MAHLSVAGESKGMPRIMSGIVQGERTSEANAEDQKNAQQHCKNRDG